MVDKKGEIIRLLIQINDPALQFFDIDSNEMLDEKIEILQRCANGENIMEIGLHILEKMPQNGIWDMQEGRQKTMNTCKHERIKSVNCRIFCVSCGEELSLDYLFGKHEQAAEKPENKQETPKKTTRKRKA